MRRDFLTLEPASRVASNRYRTLSALWAAVLMPCPEADSKAAIVFLTTSTTHRPATDLGYLLHKNPARVQGFSLPFERAHVVMEAQRLCVPKPCSSWNRGHLSRRVSNRGVPQPGGGMGAELSAGAIEQRQRRDWCARNWGLPRRQSSMIRTDLALQSSPPLTETV